MPSAGTPGDSPESGTSRSRAFNFTSTWWLETERKRVWDALVDFRAWPDWWPGLEEMVELDQGGPDGIGQKARSRWRGPIGYVFSFTIDAVERREPEFLAGAATGDLTGMGSWSLTEYNGWTGVTLVWSVDATRRWMEFLAPVARPVFVHGHDHVMKAGASGLASHLDVAIRDFHSTS